MVRAKLRQVEGPGSRPPQLELPPDIFDRLDVEEKYCEDTSHDVQVVEWSNWGIIDFRFGHGFGKPPVSPTASEGTLVD